MGILPLAGLGSEWRGLRGMKEFLPMWKIMIRAFSVKVTEKWGGKGGVERRWKGVRDKDALPPLGPFNPFQEDHQTLQGQLR